MTYDCSIGFNHIKMPPNSVVKTSLIVGGLTFLGFMAGGRLGSMFGKIFLNYT